MTKRIALGALVAVVLAVAAAVIWIPGCGIVDIWLYIQWGCAAAGGGGGGAG